MSAKLYRQAVSVLKPSKAKMEAIHKQAAELRAIAEENVLEMIASGFTAQELYKMACEQRKPDESKLATETRVVLLGMVRRQA